MAQSAAGGSVLGHSKEIVSASATASAFLTTDNYANVTVKVFGATKFTDSANFPAFVMSKTYQTGFDQHETAVFTVGPFDIDVTVGVAGSVGVTYSLGVNHSTASASLTPFAKGNVYGSAALGIFPVEVGVGANLTLINDSLPITAGAKLAPNYFASPPSWGIKWDFDIANKMTLLSGNLYVFATIDLWFTTERWQTDIFSWPGFTINSTLFSDTGWVSIGVLLPQITSLDPPSVPAGSGDVHLTINGTGFGTTFPPALTWDGAPIATTSVTASQITATIPALLLFSPGQHFVKIVNQDVLGGPSNALPFHIVLPPPLLTQMSPGGATVGGPEFTLMVNGSWLVAGSTVFWNSTPLATTHVSDSQLTAIVPVALTNSVGPVQVTVTQPAPSTQNSNPLTLPVLAPEPVLTGTRPFRAWPGINDLTVHVLGTGFLPSSTVFWSGSPLQTTYVSGVQLDAVVPAFLLTQPGVAAVDVINPASAPSNAKPFTIAATTYSLVEIPALPGYGSMAPVGVNVKSLVVGRESDITGSTQHGFYWSSSSGTVDLGTPKVNPFCVGACPALISPLSVNNLGQIVGFATWDTSPGIGAFLYGNGTLSNLPAVFQAGAINDAGQIAGTDYASKAVLWQAGQLTSLGSLNFTFSSPTAINGTGQVVGGLTSLDGRLPQAFTWHSNGMTQLPSLLGGAIFANAVNDFGVIVGFEEDPGHVWHAVMWDNSINEHPVIAPADSRATGINNNGDVVGNTRTGLPTGWLSSNGNWYDLNTLLSQTINGRITSAVSIADGGQIAVLVAHPDGTQAAALLTPDGSAGLPPDPPPTITTVGPNTVVEGSNSIHLAITGTEFVLGTDVYWNGKALSTTFNSSTSLTAVVPPTLVAQAGYATITAINPGGAISNAVVISIAHPTPIITSISPAQTVASSAGFTLTATGNGFVPGSVVYWNGTPLVTTYVSSTQLTAVVPAGVLTSPAAAAITVVNPAPGGGASATVIFGINPPAPIAGNLSPSSAVVGASGFTLTISGSGFDATSVVSWNGTVLSTTFVSPFVLTVQIPASYLVSATTAAVTVTDTIPGGWPSQGLHFNVNNPMPQVTGIAPNSVQAVSGASTLTLSGAGFVPDSQITLDGIPLTTTYVSATQLTASLSDNDVVAAKTAQLTVVNPQPSDTPVSAPIAFTITAPPRIQTATPAIARAGSAAFTMQVTGSGFNSHSVVTLSGTPLTTSVVSAAQLNAVVPAQLMATAGSFPIRVTQRSPGGGSSAAVAFTVYATTLPQPAITALAPSAVMAGTDHLSLAISGSGILSTTSARWNGAALPSTFLSPNMLLVHVPAANISSAGKVTIQLLNPPDNTGSGGGLSNSVVFAVFDGGKATTTEYTSAAAFASATSNLATLDFNGVLQGGETSKAFSPLNIYGITFSAPIPSATVNVAASGSLSPIVYPSDYLVSSPNPGADTILVISLPAPAYAIGLNYGGLSGSGASTITLSNGHDFSQPTTPAAGKTQFAGFVSVDPITSLTLTTSGDSWVVLNLLISSPLPPTTTLASSQNPAIAGQAVTFTAAVTPAAGSVVPTGSIVFLDGGTQIGTADLDNTGKATFQTSTLSVAQHSLAAQYVGDANYKGGSLSAVLTQTIAVTPPPDFTFAPNLPSVTVASPGASSPPVTFTITAVNGYNGTVNFTPASCSISPAGSLSSCSFSPASITGSGSTQVTIHTTAASTTVPVSGYRPDGFTLWVIGSVVLLVAFLWLRILAKRTRWSTAVAMACLLSLAAFLGCGGGGGSSGGGRTGGGTSGTPAGVVYSVTVTATAAGGTPNRSATFTFNVQ